MFKKAINALKGSSSKAVPDAINLQNVGWHLDAEGSDERATQGARLALELLWPHYDAFLAVYPDEFEGFEPMLRSAPGEHVCHVEQDSHEAFKPEVLKESGAIFTYPYSLAKLCSSQGGSEAAKARQAENVWIEGMRELTSHRDVNCCVIIVGENPFGPDFLSKCRAMGVGRVLITNWDDSLFDITKLDKLHRLPRTVVLNHGPEALNRMYTVSELLAGSIPPIARFKEERPLNLARSA